jgi:hypothetical protein
VGIFLKSKNDVEAGRLGVNRRGTVTLDCSLGLSETQDPQASAAYGAPQERLEKKKEAGIELVAAKVEVEHYVHGIAAPVRRQLRHLIDAQHRSRC